MIRVVNVTEIQLFRMLQIVRGAKSPAGRLIKDVGIEHGGTDILVTQQLRNRTYILAPL